MQFPFAIRNAADLDVIGFGTNAVDFLIEVPEYPSFNSKIELIDYVQAAGGEVATTMAGLQRLGLRTAYAGRFGDDAAGEFGLDSLRAEGVDLEFAERILGARTQIAFIVIDVRSGERTVIWQRDEKLAYAVADAPVGLIERTRVLHFTPHDAGACLELAKEARRHGVIVSADIDSLVPGAEELFSFVDIFIASADFPGKLFGAVDERDALRKLRDMFGCGLVGVTLGRAGSLLLCGDTYIESPGFAVPGGCRDTTGAGDAFRVGILYGLLTGRSVEESAEMANAVAALKCRAVGARTALPTVKEVAELVKKS